VGGKKNLAMGRKKKNKNVTFIDKGRGDAEDLYGFLRLQVNKAGAPGKGGNHKRRSKDTNKITCLIRQKGGRSPGFTVKEKKKEQETALGFSNSSGLNRKRGVEKEALGISPEKEVGHIAGKN